MTVRGSGRASCASLAARLAGSRASGIHVQEVRPASPAVSTRTNVAGNPLSTITPKNTESVTRRGNSDWHPSLASAASRCLGASLWRARGRYPSGGGVGVFLGHKLLLPSQPSYLLGSDHALSLRQRPSCVRSLVEAGNWAKACGRRMPDRILFRESPT